MVTTSLWSKICLQHGRRGRSRDAKPEIRRRSQECSVPHRPYRAFRRRLESPRLENCRQCHLHLELSQGRADAETLAPAKRQVFVDRVTPTQEPFGLEARGLGVNGFIAMDEVGTGEKRD